MRIIGITGGVGAGKSTVLSLLKELCSCKIIMADDVAKNLMKFDGFLGIKAVELFGEKAFNSDKSLNTAYISGIMYNNQEIKEQWTGMVHPAVNRAIYDEINCAAESGKYEFVFVEAALLIENKYNRICDEIWYIYADMEKRIERLHINRGYSKEKSLLIMNCQMTDSEFRQKCDYTIDNSVDVEFTRKQLENKLEEYLTI